MSDNYSRYGQSGPGGDPGEPAEEDAMAAEHDTVTDFAPRYSVGDELRMRRESMGKSIADAVDAVRIQGRYLEALEDGRIDDLPGAVYALGFVRTYADYLGLDGPEVVARYKEETQGLKTQSYAMPEPLEEGKVPTAAILLVAVVLAATAYGVWYFLSQQDDRAAQVVPEVPERLAAVTETPAPVPEDSVQAVPAPASAPAAVPLSPVEGDAPPPAADLAPAAPAPPASSPPETVAAAPAEAVTVPKLPPAPQAAVPAPVAAAPEVPAAEPPASDAEVGAPEAVAAAAPPVPGLDEEPREPRVYGLGNADSRIVIVAIEDAWLEVTDSDDARLFSRVLRKGDRYRAPNRAGAKFVTGNAGGLQVMVDGEPVPSLGPPGQVRRDVKLDPDLLKAGQAWP